MRRLPAFATLLALGALLVPSAALAGDCQNGDLKPAADNLALVSAATLCLLNAERAGAQLSPVTEQGQLTAASEAYSELMVSQRFFGHVSPDGSQLTDRLTAVDYLGHPGSWVVGENIAWGESYLATPAEIVKAWMNSPPHRENILDASFEDIGLGIAIGTPTTDSPGATYTTDFGRRRVAADAPDGVAGPAAQDAASVPAPAVRGTARRTVARRTRPRRRSTRCRRVGRSSHGARRAAVRVQFRMRCRTRARKR